MHASYPVDLQGGVGDGHRRTLFVRCRMPYLVYHISYKDAGSSGSPFTEPTGRSSHSTVGTSRRSERSTSSALRCTISPYFGMDRRDDSSVAASGCGDSAIAECVGAARCWVRYDQSDTTACTDGQAQGPYRNIAPAERVGRSEPPGIHL
jgi:hypothetical protein